MPYKVLTTEPTEVPALHDVVYFSRKSTKQNPVPESESYRAVVVPAYSLPVLAEGTDEVFATAIREAFFAAAGEILKAQFLADKTLAEVVEESLTFSAVVEKMQEAQTSKRLNGEQIAAWYDASATSKEAAARYGVDESGIKKQTALRAHFVSLASNNPGILPQLATKMIGYVSTDDVSSTVCQSILKKLAACAKKDTSDDL